MPNSHAIMLLQKRQHQPRLEGTTVTHENGYEITDITLAPEGRKRIAWARANMPILRSIGQTFARSQPFENLTIAICLHLEAKTAVWLDVLKQGGAEIAITGSPGSTQDDTAAALVADHGIAVFTRSDESFEDHLGYCKRVLEFSPDLIADNGGDLHALLAQEPAFAELAGTVMGGTEETTTGARRIREKANQFEFPTLVINDTDAKRIVENRFGVGSSVVDGLMRATNIMLHGKRVAVVGYGYCGSGTAQRLRGMGAHVTVVDADPLKQLEAHLEGFSVSDLNAAVETADIILTVTGFEGILGARQFAAMKEGALIANAGHFASEIDLKALQEMAKSKEEVRDHICKYVLEGGKNLYLIGDGNLVNLSAGDGNPIEIMDLGLALQSLSLARMASGDKDLPNGAQRVPRDIEQVVAKEALKHWTR